MLDVFCVFYGIFYKSCDWNGFKVIFLLFLIETLLPLHLQEELETIMSFVFRNYTKIFDLPKLSDHLQLTEAFTSKLEGGMSSPAYLFGLHLCAYWITKS